MKYFLDISLLCLVIFVLASCVKKGFVRSVFGAAKTLLAIVLTFCLGGRVSAYLHEHWVGERVFSYVHGRLLAMFESGQQTFDLTLVFERLPNWLRVLLESVGVDPQTVGGDLAGASEASASRLEELARSLARPITELISDLLAYAAVFLFSLLALSLVAFLLGKLADLPVIKSCDRFLGLLLGVLSAAIYASVYTVLLFAVLSMVEGGSREFAFHTAYESTVLFRWVYEHNAFRWIFGIG